MKVVIMVLVLFAATLLPTVLFAQETSKPNGCEPLDFRCRIQFLEASLRSANKSIRFLELRGWKSATDDLQTQIDRQRERISGIVSDLNKLMEDGLAKSDPALQPSGPSPPAPDPSAALADLNHERRLGEIDTSLFDHGGRLNRMADNISGLTIRLQGVERQLRRRAIRFDAGGFGLLSRGFMAVGGLGAITWPLGQDGDWAVRLGVGAGQGWSDDALHSVAWLAKADLLYRWEAVALGLTGTLIGGAVRDGNRYLSWDGGLTGRVEPASWLFLQVSAISGAAMGTNAQLQPAPIGGMLETGLTF